jgi:hypothetical protein
MTKIQLVIVIALIAVIAAIAAPRAVKMSRISRAERDVLSIADGFVRYRVDTEGRECQRIEDLVEDPGVPGWMGPYISRKLVQSNPWEGMYGVDLERQRVVIPKGDAAPDQYEIDGSEEISFSYAKEMKLE